VLAPDDLLAALPAVSDATRRAYGADLRDLELWCRRHGIEDGLTGRQVFAYALGLVRSGSAPSTVRRRLTTLRQAATAVPGAVAFDPAELARFERRILDADGARVSVLVVSDDAVIRAGLLGVLTESGAVCWSEPVDAFDPTITDVWDYILVWIGSWRGGDRYGAIPPIGRLAADVTTSVPVVAVHGGDVPEVVRLRLAEAGFRYLVPHAWLSSHLGELSELLSTASLPIRYHLGTPFAVRQSLGLRLSGSLSELVEAAAGMPLGVWNATPSEAERMPRAEINRLRTIALHSAGVPAPDFAKYATSMRRPPDLPEWPRVRSLLREALGHAPTTSP
jgi:hypothetical protein